MTPPHRSRARLRRLKLQHALAVAQPAELSIAPAPDSAASGEGEAVQTSSRHGDDALASKGLHLLGLPLVLPVAAVAQLAVPAAAPGPKGAVRGESEAEVS